MVNSSNPTPEILAHRYRVVQVLGEGGFGTTYLAADTQMPSQRQCVVKQLKPMENNPSLYPLVKERFQREAAILEMLGDKCEQIPRLYANFSEGQKFYLVEEWIQGETLAQKVEREGLLIEDTVRGILLGVLPTLASIHEHKIVHRDIKPDNILLRAIDQQPVLIDFGAVKETMRTVVMGAQDQPSQSIVVGTPGFMSSEQMAGYPVFSSDLFSLGITAIYMLTGRMPQMIESDPSTGSLNWHVYAPNLSPSFRESIDRSIKLHPKERYQSAEEMQTALLSHPNTLSIDEPLPPTEPVSWVLRSHQTILPNQQESSFQTEQNAQTNSPETLSALPQPTKVNKPKPSRYIVSGIIGAAIAGGAVILASILDIQITSKLDSDESEPDKSVLTSPTTVEPSAPPIDSPTSPQTSSPRESTLPPSNPSPSVSPTPSTQAPDQSSSQTVDQPVPLPQWEFMGKASTGESVSVNTGSIQKNGTEVRFRYQIGTEQIIAKADCLNNRWFAEGYGWFNPQSSATQKMINYVCSILVD